MSLAFCLKRRISMFRKLQRLSRGRVALRKGDSPRVREEYGPTYYSGEGWLTCYTSCVACARIRDAGVFACLPDLLRVLTQGRREGRMGQAGYVTYVLPSFQNKTRSPKWVTHVCAPFRSTGTRWDGVCFRRFLLDTVPDLGPFLCTLIPDDTRF
jgi:hypothetical protein